MRGQTNLGEFVTIRTGKLDANASSENGIYPFFTCAINPRKIDNYAYDCECVLVAGNGDLNVKYYNGKFNAYQRTYIIESKNKDNLYVRYLYHCLSKHIEFLRIGAIGGVIKYIKLSHLTDIKLPLPPLDIQKKIAIVLDKADQLRHKRKKAIEKFDQLIQSVFLDMFGDSNDPIFKLSELCEFITKGTTPKSADIDKIFQENYIPFLKVYHIDDKGNIDFDYRPSYVHKDIHEGFLKRSKVYPDDVIMNIVGPPLGKIGIVPNTYPEWNINQAIAIFRSTKRILPLYLFYMLRSQKVLSKLLRQAVGIRQQNISLKQCRNVEIPLASLKKQEIFVKRVTFIRNQILLSNQLLLKSNNLFNSLLQQALKGELKFNDKAFNELEKEVMN
jgi:type I restriction enzyme, S subunit